MKLSDILKFILLVVHCVEADRDTEISGFDNLMDDKVKADRFFEHRFIVLVTTAVPRGESEMTCTGTLIRQDLVLTLASCLLLNYHDDPYPEATKVLERPTGSILYALKIFINPNFYSEDKYVSNAHNFGLIVVERSDQSDLPQLPRHSYNFKDIKNTCLMGGYGTKKNTSVINNFEMYYMKETKVDIFGGRDCSSGVKICLHFPDIMPCTADFGTPLMCYGDDYYYIYALYVPAKCARCLKELPCLDYYITAFSPVYNIKDWVIQIMDAPTSHLEWLNNPWYVLILCCVVFIFMAGIYYGLVEFLQRTFDPAEGMQTQMAMDDDDKDDEESWYESQWVTR